MSSFLEMAAERFSVRKYSPAPVEEEKIAAILEAARLAPTACNYQSQKIYVVRDPEKLAALREAKSCIFDAPVVFVIGYDITRSAKGIITPDHDFGDTDAAIVGTHMMFEAHELGLSSCWVGMFKQSAVKEILGLPENIQVRNFLPVGYAAEGAAPAPLHTMSRELSDIVEFI